MGPTWPKTARDEPEMATYGPKMGQESVKSKVDEGRLAKSGSRPRRKREREREREGYIYIYIYIYERVYFVSYKKWRVKATTETFIFPRDFFQDISKTHMKIVLVNSWEKVSVGFR